MKSLLLLAFAISFPFNYSSGQTIIWENLFPANQTFVTLLKTLDGKLIASGGPQGSNQFPMSIVKYDTEGNLLWQRSGRVMHTGQHDFKQTPDGRYLFAGNMFKNQPGNYRDTFLQQFDENGDTTLTWAQTYAEPSWDYPTEMVLLDSGDIAIAGLQLSPSCFTLRKTDSLGNTKWYKKYGHSASTYGTQQILNHRKNLVMLGMTRPTTIPWHPYLIEVNLDGDSIQGRKLILQDTITMEQVLFFYNNLIQTKDLGYVISGDFSESGFVAKTDSAFNLLWYYEIPPQQASANEHITSKVIELQDSTLLFMSRDNAVTSTSAFYITRLSKAGDSLSITSIQSDVCPGGNMMPYNWQFLADSSIVICGWCVSNQQAYIGRWGNLNFPLPMGFFPIPAQ